MALHSHYGELMSGASICLCLKHGLSKFFVLNYDSHWLNENYDLNKLLFVIVTLQPKRLACRHRRMLVPVIILFLIILSTTKTFVMNHTKHFLNVCAIAIFVTISLSVTSLPAQTKEPWTARQLMPAAELAKVINDPDGAHFIIFSIGPGAVIKGSRDIGPTKQAENLAKLKDAISKLPKDSRIVLYCGCCPFEHCPNIRPAFTLLNEMGLQHAFLLNIEHNIKTDWIDKHYPVVP